MKTAHNGDPIRTALTAVFLVFVVACDFENKPPRNTHPQLKLAHPLTPPIENSIDYIRLGSVVPAQKDALWWQRRHDNKVSIAREGGANLIIIGDSLVHNFEGRGRQIYYLYFGRYNPLNLGFNADLTQNALWRIQNGEVDGLSPKLAIIMIGTNNSGRSTSSSKSTFMGISAIVEELRYRLPETKILLLGIFPRGPTKKHVIRQRNERVNSMLPMLADEKWVFYRDIGSEFLDRKGRLSRNIMYDFLHPTVKGYQIWAESISPIVLELMRDTDY